MKRSPETFGVPGKGRLSAVLSGPPCLEDGNRTGVVIAHGAANDMNNPLIVAVAEGLASAGYTTLRFNFPYREKGRKSPDAESTLAQAWQAAVDHVVDNGRFPVERVVAAGKSLGGRIASQMAAAGQLQVDALIFLGYPLHAPGRPDNLRDSHLYEIKQRMLFFAGTRDPLCKLEKLQGVLKHLSAAHQLEIVEGGDHSFRLPKSLSRTADAVYRQIVRRCIRWLGAEGG